MSTNTHQSTLARALARTDALTYQQALHRVRDAAAGGTLPPRLVGAQGAALDAVRAHHASRTGGALPGAALPSARALMRRFVVLLECAPPGSSASWAIERALRATGAQSPTAHGAWVAVADAIAQGSGLAAAVLPHAEHLPSGLAVALATWAAVDSKDLASLLGVLEILSERAVLRARAARTAGAACAEVTQRVDVWAVLGLLEGALANGWGVPAGLAALAQGAASDSALAGAVRSVAAGLVGGPTHPNTVPLEAGLRVLLEGLAPWSPTPIGALRAVRRYVGQELEELLT